MASAGVGLGSTFTAELPAAPPPVNLHAEETRDPEDAGPAAAIRVLLVEDNRDSLRNLTWALGRLGHAVVGAESLAAAREALSWGAFDLVVSDIQLPDGTGLELMSELVGAGGVPGIALSGYGSEEDVRESLAAGFREHLVKPVTFSALDSAIRRLAAGRPDAVAAAATGLRIATPRRGS